MKALSYANLVRTLKDLMMLPEEMDVPEFIEQIINHRVERPGAA